MTIILDDRFTIQMTGTPNGWLWLIWDDFGDDGFEYVAKEPAKDQTEVFLLAAEVIKERY